MLSLKSKKALISLLSIIVLFAHLTFSQYNPPELIQELETVIKDGRRNIWSEIEPNEPLWNHPPWLGTLFISEYYFQLKALNLNQSHPFHTKFDTQFFVKKLLKEQLPDGSWKQLIDQNRKEGLLDATIFNYWFLKEMGLDVLSTPMKNARKFILDNGGIQKAQMMTKYKLAAFGQYQWQMVNYIPLFLFQKNSFPFYSLSYLKNYVAQWVYPHLTGLAYLRYQKTIFPVSKVCLSQLMTSRGHPPCLLPNQSALLNQFNKLNGSAPLQRDQDVDNVLFEALELVQQKGAFGGYTISTLLNLMAFKDYTLKYDPTNNQLFDHYNRLLNKSLTYVQSMYFNEKRPYEGHLCDGRYWDTILAVFGLLESGQSPEKVHHILKHLIKVAVQQNGGIPYGQQFQYAPDIDDTGMLLVLYGKLKKHFNGTQNSAFYQRQINRTYSWLRQNQNSDGGFPAFEPNKNDGQYKLLAALFWLTQIDKSAEIFDPSCPDIVGHLFEGMVEAGIYDAQLIQKAISYLFNSRKDGMWSARWGINYVYAVGAVYPGLAKLGYDMNQEWIKNITKKLVSVQQADGGFGQDSQGYNKGRYIEGVTTASMTAWGLLAYVEVAHTMNIQNEMYRAASYLLKNFKENGGKFYDRSVVGTGHRGLLNLQYPIYSYSFPLVALARYRDYLLKKKKYEINNDLMERARRITQVNPTTNDL